MKKCVNCGTESEGNYCYNCGQKLENTAVSWKAISSDISDRWIGLDTKFLRTVVDLTIRPGKAIRSYLSGNRVRYVGPLGYFMVMSAILVIIAEILQIDFSEFIQKTNEAMGAVPSDSPPETAEFQQAISNWMARNFRWIPAMLIPFLALSSRIFFKGFSKSYLHHLVVIGYFQSHGLWISIVQNILFSISGEILNTWILIISFLYYTIAMVLVLERKNYLVTVLKIILAWVFGYLMFTLASGIIGAVYAFITLV
jgi:hypothetical protein